MQLKLLQLNIWAGTHFPVIEHFLRENDFDILCFQEVSGPRHQGNVQVDISSYEELQRVLNTTHNVEFIKSQTFMPTPDVSFEGNAIFYKKAYSLISKDVLWLHKRDTPFPAEIDYFEDLSRTVLSISLRRDNQTFTIVNTHLAWAPTNREQPHQRKQNIKLIEYMQSAQQPWILTGDFNISPDNQTIHDLEKLGQNLTKKYGIQNTLDYMNHRAWERLKPGFAVDYIFVSPAIKIKEFKVLDQVHLSDHLALTATLSL